MEQNPLRDSDNALLGLVEAGQLRLHCVVCVRHDVRVLAHAEL